MRSAEPAPAVGDPQRVGRHLHQEMVHRLADRGAGLPLVRPSGPAASGCGSRRAVLIGAAVAGMRHGDHGIGDLPAEEPLAQRLAAPCPRSASMRTTAGWHRDRPPAGISTPESIARRLDAQVRWSRRTDWAPYDCLDRRAGSERPFDADGRRLPELDVDAVIARQRCRRSPLSAPRHRARRTSLPASSFRRRLISGSCSRQLGSAGQQGRPGRRTRRATITVSSVGGAKCWRGARASEVPIASPMRHVGKAAEACDLPGHDACGAEPRAALEDARSR